MRETDLDFKRDRIAVRRGRQDHQGGSVTYRAGGKDGKGCVVTAPHTLMDLLAEALRKRADRRALAGEVWHEQGLSSATPPAGRSTSMASTALGAGSPTRPS